MAEYIHTLPDGKEIKVVDLSDLLAVKSGAEANTKELEKLQSQLTELQNSSKEQLDSKHQEFVQLQASFKDLETKHNDLTASTGNIDELKTNLTKLTEANTGLSTKMGTLMKTVLTKAYKVGEDKLEGKSVEEMESIVNTLGLLGVEGSGPGMDINQGGNHNPPTDKTPFEHAQDTIEKLTGGNVRVSG